MKLLIKNLTLYTGNAAQPLLTNQHVAIDGERIAFILPADSLETDAQVEAFAAERILLGKNRIGMPGLINTHTHVGMSILRNYGSDLNLQDWLTQKVFPIEAKMQADDIRWAGLLEMAEMIRSGTTGFIDMYYYPEMTAANVRDSGMRAKVCCSLQPNDVNARPETLDHEGFKAFAQDWDGLEGRLRTMMLVHSTFLPPYWFLQQAGKLAQEEKYLVHIHLHETKFEVLESVARYHQRPIALADSLGLLSDRTVVAHCVHLDDNDRRILANRGAHVAHCPTSNLKLGSGIPDVRAMLGAGIHVSIGTDGASSNNNLNMMEEMHLASLLQKGLHRDPLATPAVQVLEMATRQGALAMHMDPLLGLLQAGAPADMVLLSTDEPHWTPYVDPLAALAYSAQAADVDTVIVAGRILMENREMLTIDLEQAKWHAEQLSQRLLS